MKRKITEYIVFVLTLVITVFVLNSMGIDIEYGYFPPENGIYFRVEGVVQLGEAIYSAIAVSMCLLQALLLSNTKREPPVVDEVHEVWEEL